jgi:hypothetical protein
VKRKVFKVCWHAATLFVYFIFFLHYMLSNGYTVYDEAGGQWLVMTCNGDLRGIGGFQDIVMANLLGSGGLQVTVSIRIDPFPHGTRTCNLLIRGSSGSVSAINHADCQCPHPTA